MMTSLIKRVVVCALYQNPIIICFRYSTFLRIDYRNYLFYDLISCGFSFYLPLISKIDALNKLYIQLHIYKHMTFTC